MSRRRLPVRPVCKKLSLPGDLVASVETKLFDSARGKPQYGAFAELVTELLREWLVKVETPIPSEELSKLVENPQ